MKEKFSLKDHLFNDRKLKIMTKRIKTVYPPFDAEDFEKKVLKKFPKLELKQRISWISENLKQYLPSDFRKASQILLTSLPPECDPEKSDNDFGECIFIPYSDFVAQNGCSQKDLQFSLEALKEITKRISAEDAMRYFINAFPDESLKALQKWSTDSHYHVRRLASEGLRPKLPWSQKIHIDPKRALPILNILYRDKTRFVTRSVANHLNDISKSNPDLVLKTLEKWEKSKRQQEKEMQFIMNHSLRTLIKKGHEETIKFLGFSPNPSIQINQFSIHNEEIQVGNPLEFSFTLTANKSEHLIVDYLIHFRQKSGKLGAKVHKLKKISMKKDERITINKKHPLRKNMSTRKLYEGEHQLEIQVNGKVMEAKAFYLKNTSPQ